MKIYILFGVLAVLLLVYTKFLKGIETFETVNPFGSSFCKKYEKVEGKSFEITANHQRKL
jgi:hypothetical protein